MFVSVQNLTTVIDERLQYLKEARENKSNFEKSVPQLTEQRISATLYVLIFRVEIKTPEYSLSHGKILVILPTIMCFSLFSTRKSISLISFSSVFGEAKSRALPPIPIEDIFDISNNS